MKKILITLGLGLLLASPAAPIDFNKLLKAKKAVTLVSGATHQINEEEEYYIGRAVAANILSQYPLWKNADATHYLNLIGKALVLRSARPEIFGGYHFSLLDTPEANAFSAPGGIIFLTRGIVDLAGNEDELAAILAHEIQHIVAKDPLKAIKSQRMKTLGTFAAGEAMGSGNQVFGIFQDSVLDISGTLLQKGLLARPGKERRPGGARADGRDRLRPRGPAGHARKSQGQSKRRKPRPFRPIRQRPSASPMFPQASARARRRATARPAPPASRNSSTAELETLLALDRPDLRLHFRPGKLSFPAFSRKRSTTRRSAFSAGPAPRRSSWSRSTRKASISTAGISKLPGPGRAASTHGPSISWPPPEPGPSPST